MLQNLRSTILNLIFTVVGFMIEYQCFADSKSCLPKSFSDPAFLFFIFIFCVTAFLHSFYNLFHILFNSQQYFREDFSLQASFVALWVTLIFIVSFIAKLMPWQLLITIVQRLSQRTSIKTSVEPHWAEYFLLLLITIVILSWIFNWHQQWSGRKSNQQHSQEQESETTFFIREGIKEFLRRWRKEPLLTEYLQPESATLITPIEPPIDENSQAWQDQACELLRLSSSSYVFDEDDWHDIQKCWVGKNINTHRLVFLYPVQEQLNDDKLNNYKSYADDIANSKEQQIDEIVVAFKNDKDEQATNKNHQQIRFVTEKKLLDELVNFTDYYNDIRKRVEVTSLSQVNRTLKDVYVPSKFKFDNNRTFQGNIEEFLRNWLDEPTRKQIALLGEYGLGKSSTALMLTYHIIFKQPASRIPILIELRGKSPRNLSPLELLGAWACHYRIEPQALMRLHIAGRLLLIFEGFDEMALSGNSEARMKHFKTLWQFCYPQAKIIITGRPNFFLDEQEMKVALGIEQPIGDNPYCEAIQLLPFAVPQISESLKYQKEETREQISSLAETNSRFLEIVSRPSLLHVVSSLWEEENFGDKQERLTSALVMNSFVKNSYRRQGIKAKDADFMALNSSEREYFMEGVASYMAAKDLKNQISSEDLNQLIKDLINNIPDSVSKNVATIIPEEDTTPLKQRIKEKNGENYVDHIQTDVRTCGLLASDLSAPGKFKFGHKSFMEYLFASTMAQSIIVKEEREHLEKLRAIVKTTRVQLDSLLTLPVSLEFLSELLGTDIDIRENNDITNTISSNLKGKRVIARKILNEIFNIKNNKVKKLICYITLFNITCMELIINREKNKSRNIFLLFTIMLSLLGLTIFASMETSTLNIGSGTIRRYLSPLPIFIMLTSSLLYNYLIIIFLTTTNKSKMSTIIIISKKLYLWNKICIDLKIEDQVLHEVAGTWKFPWAKNQRFDYFLKYLRSIDEVRSRS